MASPTDVSPPPAEPGMTTEQPKNSRPRPNRLNQALAWVGVVAGGLFVVAGIFFSGFFLSWSHGEHMGPGPMACCDHMKPGEQMKPGAMTGPDGQMRPGGQMTPGDMMPGRMMGPGGMMGPVSHSPTTAPPNVPRP